MGLLAKKGASGVAAAPSTRDSFKAQKKPAEYDPPIALI